jgi:hypothetical protein
MAHAAPPPAGRRQRARILGLIVVVLGVALLAVTIVALNRPKQHSAARSTLSGSATTSEVPDSTPATSSVATTSAPTSTPEPTPTPTPTPTPIPTPAAVAKVPLIVANNTGAVGLAQTAAARFQANGWQVTDLSNFTGDIISTCAYYDPSNPANQAAALELQKEFPAIKRVKERFSGLPSAPIVVVLTRDYS